MKRFFAIFMMCASIVGLSAAINGTEMTANNGTKAAKAATKGTKKAGTKAEAKPVEQPVREFRGAWIHTIFQKQYSRQSTAENKAYLCRLLDSLRLCGCNAIVFQVRPQADALYPSELEPWSRHLSGTAGVAPDPLWDPLKFMIDESHARGMELHSAPPPSFIARSVAEKAISCGVSRMSSKSIVESGVRSRTSAV